MHDNVFDANYRAGHTSGIGSVANSTIAYRNIIESFIWLNDVRSVIDVGCGDWAFSKLIPWDDYNISYIGVDVSSIIIERNKVAFGTPNRQFRVISHPSELVHLGRFDLVICKDVLQHIPLADANAYLDGFVKIGRHALVTNDVFPSDYINHEIEAGGYRALDIRKPPFSRNSSVIAEYTNSYGNSAFIKRVHLLAGAIEVN